MTKRTVRKKASIRGIVRILTIAVMIPAFFLSVLLYKASYTRYYETILSANEAILNAIAVSVEENEKLIENSMELLSYDKSILALLRKRPAAYSKVVQQVFEIQELIGEREVLLSHLGGEIIVFSDKESVPASYWYVLPTDRAMEMEGYHKFLRTGQIGSWTGEELMYPESTVVSENNRKTMLSYYRFITDSISGRIGVLKCGVQKKRFLEAVSTTEVDGALFVTQGEQIIYGEIPKKDVRVSSFDMTPARYDMDGLLYITHPIRTLDMNFIIALDKRWIIGQAAVYALPQLLIILGMELIMLIAGRRFTHLIYRRIDQIVDVAENAKSNYMDVILPNSDDDDISVLIDALNTLIQQIRSHACARIEHEQKEKSALRMAFQYQMNPHFLFNTLNWIQMCIELGAEPEKTSEGIVVLGRLLRYNLNGEAYAPISQEIARTEDYIQLMNMRKNDAISLSIHLADVDPQQQLMRFMLQPLCENAIQHGLASGRQLHIDIQISRADGEFIVVVKNDGTMIDPEMIEEIRNKVQNRQGENGVGLANLYSRIKLLYGEASDLILESKREETSITLKLKETNALKLFEEVS